MQQPGHHEALSTGFETLEAYMKPAARFNFYFDGEQHEHQFQFRG